MRVGLAALEIFIGLGALPAGWALVADPSGGALGMPREWLRGSPFADYLVPGLVLFVVNGVGQLAGGVLTFLQRGPYRALAAGLGLFLLLWIAAQVYWIGYGSFLQPLYFLLGLLELGLALRAMPRGADL